MPPNPEQQIITLQAAEELYDAGQYPQALECFKRLGEDQPDYEKAVCYIGKTLLQLGRAEEAIVAFERHRDIPGVDVDEASHNIILAHIQCLEKSGSPEEVIKHFRCAEHECIEATRRPPENWRFHLDLAKLYIKLLQRNNLINFVPPMISTIKAKAKREYERAIVCIIDETSEMHDRAFEHFKRCELVEARRCYESCISLLDSAVDIHRKYFQSGLLHDCPALGLTVREKQADFEHLTAGERLAIIPIYKRLGLQERIDVVTREREDHEAAGSRILLELAERYIEQRNFGRAEDLYTKCTKYNSNNLEAWDACEKFYIALGDQSRARRCQQVKNSILQKTRIQGIGNIEQRSAEVGLQPHS